MSLIELIALIFTFNLVTFGNGPVMIPRNTHAPHQMSPSWK